MTVSLAQIKQKMIESFGNTRAKMAEDVQSFKKHAGDVNKGVNDVQSGLNKEL